MTQDKLIRLFTMDGMPYLLSYEYRKKGGKAALTEAKPHLDALLKSGNVTLLEKTAKRLLYHYAGK